MEIELVEIRDFIARYPPFNVLDMSALNEIPAQVNIGYLKQGNTFPGEDNNKPGLYLVRSGAIELRNSHSQLIDKLAEGDIYLDSDDNEPGSEQLTGQCVEDVLFYFIHQAELTRLQQNHDSFSRQFNLSIKQRIRNAVEFSQYEGMRELSAMKMEVIDLTDRHPVITDINTSIRNAAQLMTAEKVSSILVTKQDKLVGVLTDRDIRSRCVAEGVDINDPVDTIMTSQLEVVADTTLLSDALLVMTKNQINHLPVLRNEKPVGILTTSDVVRHLSANPTLIASDINKAVSVDALTKISSRLPELQLQLSLSSATAKHIGEVISSITDAITCRLLQLAEKEYGVAPCEYVWLAGGSQARNEQTSHSDQDNAIIISDKVQDNDLAWFENLSNFVCDGLNACGYIYCPGDAMAMNKQWRQPLNVWKEYFTDWITKPEPKSLMLSSIFFDLRPVYGDFTLFDELQTQILKKTRKNELFTAHMIANALTHKPPLGFFRSFVLIHDDEHNNTLDIKHRGIVPVVDIARVLCLDNGIQATNTVDRLNLALNSGALSSEMHDNLVDALEYISSLRIRHQAKQIQAGLSADNYLPPDELSGLERSHLKDAFSIIKVMQQYFESRSPVSFTQ